MANTLSRPEWENWCQAFGESHQTKMASCRTHDLIYHQFLYWFQKLNKSQTNLIPVKMAGSRRGLRAEFWDAMHHREFAVTRRLAEPIQQKTANVHLTNHKSSRRHEGAYYPSVAYGYLMQVKRVREDLCL